VTQREILKARSAKMKNQRGRNEEFDEEKSRHKHNLNLENSVNGHFHDLKTVLSKRKIEPEVTTILRFQFRINNLNSVEK
jgi:hypothetical protein